MSSIIFDLIDHPFCTSCILLLLWFWAQIMYDALDIRKYSLSVSDCWINRQYWRMFTSPFLHNSSIHLFLDVSCLWNLRYIEINYGTWFMVKYSIILCLSEAIITYSIMGIFSRFVDNPVLSDVLYRLQYHGTSGFILAWLAFQSVEVMNEKTNSIFMLFGFLSIPSSFAPVILIGFYYLFSSRNNGVANSSGMFAGYLLGVGFLRILDSGYWTVCILLNITLFFIITGKGTQITSGNRPNERNSIGVIGEFPDSMHENIAVRYYQDTSDGEFLETIRDVTNTDRLSSVDATSAGGVEMRSLAQLRSPSGEDDIESKATDENKEEDSLEPLLSDNSGLRNRDTYSSMGWSQTWPFRRNNSSATTTMPTATGSNNLNRASSIPHRLLVNEEDTV